MKIGKLILTSTVILVAILSAFAVSTKNFVPASVYYKPAGASTYTLIQCTLTPRNTFCNYIISRKGAYYTFNGSTYSVIANGQPFFVPTAQ
jgi:hypothetical protein